MPWLISLNNCNAIAPHNNNPINILKLQLDLHLRFVSSAFMRMRRGGHQSTGNFNLCKASTCHFYTQNIQNVNRKKSTCNFILPAFALSLLRIGLWVVCGSTTQFPIPFRYITVSFQCVTTVSYGVCWLPVNTLRCSSCCYCFNCSSSCSRHIRRRSYSDIDSDN